MYSQIKESIEAINNKEYNKIIVCEDVADYFQNIFNHAAEIDNDLFAAYLKTFIVNNDDCYIANGISEIYKFSDIIDYNVLNISNKLYIVDKHKHPLAIISVIPNDGKHKENCYIDKDATDISIAIHFELYDLNSIHDKSYLLSIPLKQNHEDSEIYNVIKNDDVDTLIQIMVSNEGESYITYNTDVLNVISLIEYVLALGSIKCFKWLYLNGHRIEDNARDLVYGNNYQYLNEKGRT